MTPEAPGRSRNASPTLTMHWTSGPPGLVQQAILTSSRPAMLFIECYGISHALNARAVEGHQATAGRAAGCTSAALPRTKELSPQGYCSSVTESPRLDLSKSESVS